MNPIIALWAHPRSVSTAIERVMRERGDLTCFHEPFLYDYYIHRKVRVLPHFVPEPEHPASYDAVRDTLLEQAESGPAFIKDMSYYVMPRILADELFDERLKNSFLIRDPVSSICSYFKLDPEVTREEIGIEAQALHFQALRAAGSAPIVLQAEDVRTNPRRTIGAFWQAVGLPPADHAFEWQSESPDEWAQVAGWHGEVSASSSIRPIAEDEPQRQRLAFERLVEQRPIAQEFLDHHLPYYVKLKRHALRP